MRLGWDFEAQMLAKGLPGVSNIAIKSVTNLSEGYTSTTPFPIFLPSLPLLVYQGAMWVSLVAAGALDLRPDLVILPHAQALPPGSGSIYEIKPLTNRQVMLGTRQLAGYVTLLNLWSALFNPAVTWKPGGFAHWADYQAPFTIGVASVNTTISVTQLANGLILYDAREFQKLDLQLTYTSLVASIVFMSVAPLVSFGMIQNIGLALHATFARIEASIAAATAAAAAAASTAPAWLPRAVQLAR
jgi:hypothetical protein